MLSRKKQNKMLSQQSNKAQTRPVDEKCHTHRQDRENYINTMSAMALT